MSRDAVQLIGDREKLKTIFNTVTRSIRFPSSGLLTYYVEDASIVANGANLQTVDDTGRKDCGGSRRVGLSSHFLRY